MTENPPTGIQGELLPRIDREEFQHRLAAGLRLVWARLCERRDFVVDLGPAVGLRVVRDVTNEPATHFRAIERSSAGN